MKRLAMSELTTFSWSFEDDVHAYCQAGIGAIGVWRQKLHDFGAEKGAELLADTGLSVSSLAWIGGFTGSEGQSHREAVDDGRGAIQLAAMLKANCLIVYSGARAGHTWNHAGRLFRSALGDLLPLAEELGVKLAIEPMHPGCATEWTIVDHLQGALELLDEFASPHLQLVFDTYHLGFEAAELLPQIASLASRIALVQLGDGRQLPQGEQNRCPLGDGIIPLGEIVAELEQHGYGGPYEVELLGEDREVASYGELLRNSVEIYTGWMAADAATDG